jgi:hypothetical protein
MALKRPEATPVKTVASAPLWKNFLQKASGFLGVKTAVKATTTEARDAMMKSLEEAKTTGSTKEALENRKAEGAYFTQDVDLALEQLLIDGKLKLADAADAEKMQIVLKRLAFYLSNKEPVGIPKMKWDPAAWITKMQYQRGSVDVKKLLRDAETRIGQLEQKLAGHERKYGEKKETKPLNGKSVVPDNTRLATATAAEAERERERFAELAASRLHGLRAQSGELGRTAQERNLAAAEANARAIEIESLRTELSKAKDDRLAAERHAKTLADQLEGKPKENGRLNAENARLKMRFERQLSVAKAKRDALRAERAESKKLSKAEPVTDEPQALPEIPQVTPTGMYENFTTTRSPEFGGAQTIVVSGDGNRNDDYVVASDAIAQEATKPSAEAVALIAAQAETERVRRSMEQTGTLHTELDRRHKELAIEKEAFRINAEQKMVEKEAELAAIKGEMERMRAGHKQSVGELMQRGDSEKARAERLRNEVRNLQSAGKNFRETLEAAEDQKNAADERLEVAYKALWNSIAESEGLKKAALPTAGSTTATSTSTMENVVQSFSSSTAFAEPEYATNLMSDSVVINTEAVMAEEAKPEVATAVVETEIDVPAPEPSAHETITAANEETIAIEKPRTKAKTIEDTQTKNAPAQNAVPVSPESTFDTDEIISDICGRFNQLPIGLHDRLISFLNLKIAEAATGVNIFKELARSVKPSHAHNWGQIRIIALFELRDILEPYTEPEETHEQAEISLGEFEVPEPPRTITVGEEIHRMVEAHKIPDESGKFDRSAVFSPQNGKPVEDNNVLKGDTVHVELPFQGANRFDQTERVRPSPTDTEAIPGVGPKFTRTVKTGEFTDHESILKDAARAENLAKVRQFLDTTDAKAFVADNEDSSGKLFGSNAQYGIPKSQEKPTPAAIENNGVAKPKDEPKAEAKKSSPYYEKLPENIREIVDDVWGDSIGRSPSVEAENSLREELALKAFMAINYPGSLKKGPAEFMMSNKTPAPVPAKGWGIGKLFGMSGNGKKQPALSEWDTQRETAFFDLYERLRGMYDAGMLPELSPSGAKRKKENILEEVGPHVH